MFPFMISNRVKAIFFACLFMPVYLLAQSGIEFSKAGEQIRIGKADTATIFRLMRIGEEFLDRPESREDDMNMAFRIADQMEVQSRQLNYPRGIGLSKLLRAKAFRESGHADKGRLNSEEALDLLNIYGMATERAQAVIELGGSYSNEVSDLPRKIELYQQATAYYLKSGDMLTVAKLKEFLGDLMQLHRDYPGALKVLQEALSLYTKAGYQRLQGVYSILGVSYQGANNFVQSLRFNLLAVDAGEKLGEQGQLMSTIYNRVGLSYFSIKNYEQAIEYFDKALSQARYNQDSATIRTTLLNLSDAYSNTGQYNRSLDSLRVAEKLGASTVELERMQMEIIYLRNYVELNAVNSAAPHYEKLKDFLTKRSANEITNQMVRMAIISYLQTTGHFRETVKYLLDYQRVLKNIPFSLVRRAEGEYLAFRTDSALGNLHAAMGHYQQYKYLSDSLTSVYQAKQLGVLRLQFQIERKDQDIELLTQKSKLQEISLQKGRVFRNVVIGSICMLLLILALVYNRYRLKKKTTFMLEKQQQEINAQNGTLKKLVDEKEWLLKEIHHRVKNNLQIIISLLNTQSQYLDTADAIAAIKNSQHRMYAMSLIHQRLYNSDNLGAIDMSWYIGELIEAMQASFNSESRINFRISSESILLDMVQAIPLGLILNEAVSNSIKYAFPGNRKGAVEVLFKKDEQGYCLLSVSDNGVGFRNNYRPEEPASLGMTLMKGLSEQLDGTFYIKSSSEGVVIQVRFLERCFCNGN